jgi:N-methylhydantoinase B/oxoprolinase/acetone carboxylase alpha subunit
MAVPWNQIIRWAPHLITLSRELLQRSRRAPAQAPLVRAEDRADLAARIAALEENERRQAELVEQMAEQQAVLARAVTALHRRQKWLVATVVVLAALVAWLLLR